MPTQCEVSVCLSLAPAVIEVDGKEHGLACVGALIKYMEVRAMNTLVKHMLVKAMNILIMYMEVRAMNAFLWPFVRSKSDNFVK